MRRIAERIGYSPTSIYLHFRDKADLLQCLCKETFSRLTERFHAMDDPSAAPLDRLKKVCRAYIEFGVEHPNHYRATFMMPDHPMDQESDCESVLAAGMEAYGHFRRNIQGCMNAGLFATHDADTASQAMWASVHGLTSLLVAKCRFPWTDREALIDTLVDGMIHGLAVGGAVHAAKR
jgi:AcrR family transcriptional regulator